MSYAAQVWELKKSIEAVKQKISTEQHYPTKAALLRQAIGLLQQHQPHIALFYAQELEIIGDLHTFRDDFVMVQNVHASHEIQRGDHQKAIKICEQTLLRHQTGESTNIVLTFSILAESLVNTGKYEQSLEYIRLALALQNKLDNLYLRPYLLSLKAKNLYRQGAYTEALELCLNTIWEYRNQYLVTGWEGAISNVMGLVYSAQKQFNPSVKHYFEAAEVWEVLGNLHQLIGTYINIGSIYLYQNDIRTAKFHYNRALELNQECSENPKMQSIIFQNLGIIAGKQHNTDEAIFHYQKALDISRRTSDRLGEMQTLYNMAHPYVVVGRYERGIELLLQALKIAQETGSERFVMYSYQGLADAYARTRNFEAAYRNQEMFYELERKLFGIEKKQALLDAENILKEKIREQELQLLQQKNQELIAFAAKAAHDLRSPLRVIHSFSELLNRLEGNLLSNRGQDYLRYISASAKELDQLIKIILEDATESNVNRSSFNKINLNQIIELVLRNLQLEIQEANATIECKDLPIVQGEAALFIQIFQNLIANAVKFRREGIPPHIIITSAHIENYYQIAVKDNGKGIANHLLKNIFNFGERGNFQHTHEGNGIGLATCKAAIKKLNGDIWAISEENIGSTFYFTIPR